jgi:hypothetical protein
MENLSVNIIITKRTTPYALRPVAVYRLKDLVPSRTTVTAITLRISSVNPLLARRDYMMNIGR